MNTFGNIFRLTSFGESHGPGIGGVIDGMPAGIEVDMDFIQMQLNRRRPGQNDLTTSRHEDDQLEILSGVFEGRTTGTPIGFFVRNTNQRSTDYDALRDVHRPSHADFTYDVKYGVRDHRGGGRSSARETLTRVVGGAFAMLVLQQLHIQVQAFISQVGDIASDATAPMQTPSQECQARMEELIRSVKSEGDTIGGTITCVIEGCPAGLGEPVFGKLHAALGAAMLSINACHGFDYGAGFAGIAQRGSEQNDPFPLTPAHNNSGGIQGGISNGQPIYFRTLFKPVATLLKNHKGRHDACVLPRAVPVVEGMAAMTILDYLMLNGNISSSRTRM